MVNVIMSQEANDLRQSNPATPGINHSLANEGAQGLMAQMDLATGENLQSSAPPPPQVTFKREIMDTEVDPF